MKYLFFVILSLFGLQTFASGQWVEINGGTPAKPVTTLLSSNGSQSVIRLSIDGFWKSEVQTPRGSAWLIDLGNRVRNLQQGAPDLPYVSTSLLIPDLAKMQVEVISSEYKEYQNVLIAPSKGNLYRDVDPASVPYKFGNVYGTNDSYPGSLTKLNKPYIIRDYRGEALWIYPFQYNPVTKILKVYYNIELKVSKAGSAQINPLIRTKPLTKIDSRFNKIYKSHFLNFQADRDYTPVDEHGNMLIISYGDFMDEMAPFVTWKTQSGTHVDMVDVATIGNTAAIKQYVANYYNQQGLTFLLLVGDAAQVPTSSNGGNDSDNDYTYVVGNDHYPDLFCGRFSAENEEQVTTQVERMIEYEKTPDMSDTTWFTQSLGIASNQGTGDDGEYDWEHIRNIQENKLLPYTYVYDYELYDSTHGGHDASGNPTPAMVSDAVNDGVTIVNYCGHGSTTSWGTTGFSNSEVNNLTNAHKLPFIFSVACVNGNFVNSTCFAEAWMRAEDASGNPTGAISTIMSTINQSWSPPMCGQDAMDDILVETYPENIKRTFGGVTMNGCMEMNDTYGSAGEEMTDTWTIFGDPSLMLRTAVPQDLTVTHPAILTEGDMFMVVQCPVDGAIATLSMDGEILGSATVSGDSAIIAFNQPLTTLGNADLVVVAYNHIPYIATITITSGNGPHISFAYVTVNDSLGNNNQVIDYGEDIFLSVYIVNNGTEDVVDAITNLSTSSPYITMVDTTEDYGTIVPDDTVGIWNGYRFTVADSIPDNTTIDFMAVAQDSSEQTYTMYFSLTAHAPALQLSNYEIVDSTGNNNGNLDPGETANFNISLINNGGATATNIMGLLASDNEYITINSNSVSYGDLESDSSRTESFSVTAAPDTPVATIAQFNFNWIADNGISGADSFNIIVGQKQVVIINLAESTISPDSMVKCLDILSTPSDVVTDIPDNLDGYSCAFVCLGIYSNNHVLTSEEGDKLANFLNNGGRIYMEGGDTWYYDTPTAVHPMFHITGLEDGTDNLSTIAGSDSNFMNSFSYTYEGANNYIDVIEPDISSKVLMYNTNPIFDAAISYSDDTYKTIGSTFEFGGLVDNESSNKTGYMAEILSFFDISYVWTGIEDTYNTTANATAYPNPFSETVRFDLPETKAKTATLGIYDVSGRSIYKQTLSVNKGGINQFIWDAGNTGVNNGVYLYKIIAGENVFTGKIVYTR